MLSWAVDAALKSGLFDRIVVSTDCPEVAGIAETAGAHVPCLRPRELSDDHAPTRPVVQHAIGAVESMYGPVEEICCIYATAAFVLPRDLREGHERMLKSANGFSFSATHFPHPVQRALKLSSDGTAWPLDPEALARRSQDLEPMVHDAAQFYWGTRAAFMSGRSILASGSAAVVLPGWRVLDIDTEDDWMRAELMLELLKRNLE